MRTCPHCSQVLTLDRPTRDNVETYGRPVLVRTDCCGYGLVVKRRIILDVEAYEGERDEDDWGDKINTGRLVKSTLNDVLGAKALAFVEGGEYAKALDMIRNQTNPLTAAWLASFLCDNLGSANQQFKLWLANATYNGI